MRFHRFPVNQEDTIEITETATPRPSCFKVYVILLTSSAIVLMGLAAILVLVIVTKLNPSVSSPSATSSPDRSPRATTTRGLTPDTLVTTTWTTTKASAAIPSTEANLSRCRLPLAPRYSHKIVVAGGDFPGSHLTELNIPLALAVDSVGNLFVADSQNLRVLKFKPNSRKGEVVIGRGSGLYPRIDQPISRILIDKNDRLYTVSADTYTSYIRIIVSSSSSSNGTVILLIPQQVDAFGLDSDFNIYSASMYDLYIYMAPEYKAHTYKKLFGKVNPSGTLPEGSSNIFVDADKTIFAIDAQNRRVQKMTRDNRYADTVLERTLLILAITVDCHNNIYTIDSNATLTIYNSDGEIISRMVNTLDNPRNSEAWKQVFQNHKNDSYTPAFFASLVLDQTNGDLYVIMYGYHRVTKFTLS